MHSTAWVISELPEDIFAPTRNAWTGEAIAVDLRVEVLVSAIQRLLASPAWVSVGDPWAGLEREVDETLSYLSSPEARERLERDVYWPKWDGPWWRCVLLAEMGGADLIPQDVVRLLVQGLDCYPDKQFPFREEDVKPGLNIYKDYPCHCQLGTVVPLLGAAGVDVQAELPWLLAWFLRYQMVDGGLSCDGSAYTVEHEVPSSMVGTMAPLEAMLALLEWSPRPWRDEEVAFVDRAATFLVGRRLVEGSSTAFNAPERDAAPRWLEPCFPRFYFYDVLRGLDALTRWCELRAQPIPTAVVEPVVSHLMALAPDGVVRVGRSAHRHERAYPEFPLLERTSRVGVESPFLTLRWHAVRHRLEHLCAVA